jgi:hypothetical protein
MGGGGAGLRVHCSADYVRERIKFDAPSLKFTAANATYTSQTLFFALNFSNDCEVQAVRMELDFKIR